MIDGNFKIGNTNDVELKDFSAVPAGNYPMRMVNAEVKQNSAGTGHFLSTEFEILGDKHAGRRVFNNYNFDHPSSETVNYCVADFMRWLAACGMQVEGDITLSHVLALEGKPFLGRVGIDKKDSDRNTLKGYKPLPQAATNAGASSVAPAGSGLPSFMS